MSTGVESLNTSAVNELVALTLKKRDLEAEAKEVDKQIRAIEASLLDQFADSGISSVKAEQGTVSVLRQLWATCKDGDYERACLALNDAGLGEFVQPRFNSNTLSAYLRELDREGEPIPQVLEGAIDVAEKFSLRVTKR